MKFFFKSAYANSRPASPARPAVYSSCFDSTAVRAELTQYPSVHPQTGQFCLCVLRFTRRQNGSYSVSFGSPAGWANISVTRFLMSVT